MNWTLRFDLQALNYGNMASVISSFPSISCSWHT